MLWAVPSDVLVIPAKAGIPLLALLAYRDVFLRLRPPRRRPSHFLLLAQEKVTKEKGTPDGAPTGLLPGGSAGSGRVPLTAHPCADSGIGAIPRAAPAGLFVHCLPHRTGTP